jgi:putative membrane protein insertion efficiency factor
MSADSHDFRTRLTAGQRLVLLALRAYQILFSPMFAGSCRFTPSCSRYAAEAIGRFGVMRGGYLAARRLLRCHPFGSHGVDPVPDYAPSACVSATAVKSALRRGRLPL